MAYTKTNWVNGGPPAISAENLNNIEDGINNNDLAISALASRLDVGIQCGTIAGESIASGSYRQVSVTFSEPMQSVPVVVVGLTTNSTAAGFGSIAAGVVLTSVTVNGFNMRIHNADSVSRIPGATWIAVAL